MPALLELRDVSRSYASGAARVAALDRVSLAIHAGEFVAIIGPSGSGKSTLMNVLGCLDRPTRGSYRVRGQDVAELDADGVARLRRETFGFVFQRYHLMADSTALENAATPAVYAGVARTERERRAGELLARLGLAERRDHRPAELSGGEQQRVSIARALINGGRVILADEPTGALDRASGNQVLAVLRALHRAGHTIVLITHDSQVATHADRVIELADGRVVRDRELRAPLARPGAPLALRTAGAAGAGAVLLEAIKMALRSLAHNRLRTALTMLGIVIGVGSVIAMLAIGAGAKHQVLERIRAMGTDLLSIKRGLPGVRGSERGIITLTPEDLEPILAVPGVVDVTPETDRTVLARYGNRDLLLPALATGEAFPAVRNWQVERGMFFGADDVKRYSHVAVLGQTVVRELFPEGQDPLGRFIMIANVPFQVIGTMSPKGVSGGGVDRDYQVWVPYTTAITRLFGQRYLRDVTVKVSDSASMERVESTIRALLVERHGKEDFQIRSMADLIEAANEAQNTLTYLLGAIAVISLLVGGIGVMNIMLVAVAERTREIGVRMAVGARRRDVLAQFLTEAIAVCVLGGAAGVLIGVGSALAIAHAMGWFASINAAPIVIAVGSSVATGLAFGLLPARKAAMLDPVEALARE